jgi:hypothetical protein
VPRYTLELHWLNGDVTTGDYDSLNPHFVGDQFTDDRGVTWRIAEIVDDAPEPFLAKLVCTEIQS